MIHGRRGYKPALVGTAIGIQCVKCLWVFNRKFRSLWQLMTILNSDQKLFKAVIGCIRFLSRSNSPVAVPMYLMPAHINLVEREDVSFPKSERSISTVDKLRVAASSAAPAPVAPPPTTRTSTRFAALEYLARMTSSASRWLR